MPCHPARARRLLDKGRAVMVSTLPFCIRLKDRTAAESATQPVTLHIDPGSVTTGVAVTRKRRRGSTTAVEALLLAELTHRGRHVHKRMGQRAAYRRRRRSANLRYRKPRFDNRRRRQGRPAPSLRSRIDNTVSWVRRLARWYPITDVAMELVRFDTQQMQSPDIAGVEYQQGTLAGYEVREYLLEKWGRRCVYCDAGDVPLQIDHVVARSRGGTDRVSNLVLACRPCNEAKGNRPVAVFCADDPERLDAIRRRLKAPLADAAAVNTTRWTLRRNLIESGFAVSCWTGGRTKYNRTLAGLPKTHAFDALCVGDHTHINTVAATRQPTLTVTATGRGSYQRTNPDKSGFPGGYLPRTKTQHGYSTGDRVRAVVPTGTHTGTHVGTVAVRSSGYFKITTPTGIRDGIAHRHLTALTRANGYRTDWSPPPPDRSFLPGPKDGASRARAR